MKPLSTTICLLLCFACQSVRADYVIAFHNPVEQCPPCRTMEPIEDALVKQGYDIRRVYKKDWPQLVEYYRIRGVPQYVYVRTTARGDFDSGAPHLLGVKTAGELARYCVAPGVVGVTSAVRGKARELLSPVPVVQP